MSTRWARAALVAVVVVGDLAWLAAELRPRWEERQALQWRGFVCRRHTDGSEYVVFVPHVREVARSGDRPQRGDRPQQTQEKLPLIVFLNGAGENGDDGVRQLSNNFGWAVWELKAEFPFVLLAGQCGIEGRWTPESADTQRLMEVLDRTIAEYDIDPDRICLTGPSAGGTGVWQLGAAYADRFAAIAPLASGSCGMPEGDAIRALADANMPAWSFTNTGDAPSLVEFNRRMHAQLVAAGLESRLTEYDAAGHDCWTDAYRTPALYEWLWRQRRSASSARRKFRSLLDESPVVGWTKSAGCVVETFDDELRIEPAAGPSAGGVHCPAELGELELRFEFQTEAAGPLDVVLRQTAEPAIAVRAVLEWPEQGSGGIVSHNGEWLTSADPIAQRSLRVQSWNEVRIRAADRRLQIDVNGREWCTAALPTEWRGAWQFGLVSESPLRVRGLQWRPLAAGALE